MFWLTEFRYNWWSSNVRLWCAPQALLYVACLTDVMVAYIVVAMSCVDCIVVFVARRKLGVMW